MNIVLLNESPSEPSISIEIPDESRISCSTFIIPLQEAQESLEPDSPEPNIYQALIFVCHLHFNSESVTDPYYLPENFEIEPLLSLLENRFDSIIPADLRARVGDLSWTLHKNPHLGQEAARSYIEASKVLYDPEKWTECFDRIQRSLSLSTLINNQSIHQEGVAYIRELLFRMEGKDPLWLTVKLSELYPQVTEYVEPEIFSLLHKAANISAKQQQNHRKESSLWNCYANCAHRNSNLRQKRRAQLLAVRAKIRESGTRKKSDGNALISSSLLQEAVSDLSRIAKSASLRQKLLARLHLEQEEVTSAFGVYKTEINLKPILTEVRELLKAPNPREAILNFTSLYYPDSLSHATDFVLRKQKDFLFMHLFGATQYDSRNKVTSKRPPLPLDRPPTNEELWPELMQHYTFAQNYHGGTTVQLALREITLYHHVSHAVVEELIAESPIVAPIQRKTCAAAVYAGFHHDMPTFAYMGIPLFEGCLRYLLLTIGGTILRQDPQTGEQTEITLFGLLTNPQLQNILGENVIVDLRALLDDQHGYKLRHNLAHGLLGDAVANSSVINYAFLAFTFLLFMPLINRSPNNAA